jgi:HlyD family secretion protein
VDRKLRNRLLLFLVIAGVLAYILVNASGRQPVAKIAAVKPKRQDVIASITSNGKVEPIGPYTMRAQMVTFVESVRAMEGQAVKKGQLLLTLDVTDARAQLARARANLVQAQDDLRAARSGGRPEAAAQVNGDLAKARAERDRLQKEHEALERLLAQKAATRDELALNEVALAKAQADVKRFEAAKEDFDRKVKLDAESAALRVDQSKSEIAGLEDKVRDGEIRAPADGTLYSLPVKAGDFVKEGDLLAEMGDLHRVRVRAFIDEPELGLLEANQPVIITWDALPNRSWEGRTEIIPKQVVARGARSVGELLCSVNNDKLELLPNINVNVRIIARERHNVLGIPRGAVQSEGDRRFVYVVKDDALSVRKSLLEKREIQVGIASATSYEVVSGLKEGEIVALPGDVDLKDGMAVRVVRSE